MTRAKIIDQLSQLRDELADPKWRTWAYVESIGMYHDLQKHVATLDTLISAVEELWLVPDC